MKLTSTIRRRILAGLCGALVSVSLSSCEGLFSGVYDNPEETTRSGEAGRLVIDASGWNEWHYLDFHKLPDGTETGSGGWTTMPVPRTPLTDGTESRHGIYTYWYDVFGSGLSHHEFREYSPTVPQGEPKEWSIAVHRNNVRTNGGAAATTTLRDIDALPGTAGFLNTLTFREDEWNQTDVWVEQGKMLSGLIGNQGIEINPVLSGWLRIMIPPMPPAFTMDDTVYVIRLKDGTYGAIQLVDYQSATGTKCVLTINYRYPIVFE